MKKSPLVISVLLAFSLCAYFPSDSPAKDLILTHVPVKIYFSPQGGCTDAIVDVLNKAKSEILVQAYSFTSKPIAKALVDAQNRGVHTEIILDKSNIRDKYSAADFTAHMGIPTYIDPVHGVAHNKIMIIDQEVVITGSFNFTPAAPRTVWDCHIFELALYLGVYQEKYSAKQGASLSKRIQTKEKGKEQLSFQTSPMCACQRHGVPYQPSVALSDSFSSSDQETLNATFAGARLYSSQITLTAREGILHHLVTIEMPFVKTNARIEWTGVRVSE
jgi:hypothetical protein